ncbi:penicillin-binding protein 2 [Corynebacterium sp. MSK006]|uniref:peptidoglycan D,D-transpeptidase FtsI family protein n=1 Tax=Corynebacterium sp. MSK006 TaxID=3050187 RepID=UPI00254E8B15|nr:penicillin-binding protein 2 [Corynebacterium sp. MSK006]MDK8894383.1 penicillin-binding protein 2 [Corynebacterium sp. MSK006]
MWATVVVVIAVAALIGRLGWVQVVWGPALAEQAHEQRARVYVEPARRGEITDRSGTPMAYTMQARSLTVSPDLLRKELREQDFNEMRAEGATEGLSEEEVARRLDDSVEKTLQEMADQIPEMIAASSSDDAETPGAADSDKDSDKDDKDKDSEKDSDKKDSEKDDKSDKDKDGRKDAGEVDSDEILDKLHADTHYEVLVRNVDPDVATEIAARFHGVAADHQDVRQYPNGAVGDNVVGRVSMDGQGQFGLEASADATLTGINGRTTEDVSTDGQVIPGTLRDAVPAQDGESVSLTLDLELQTYVQQLLEQAKANSGAKSAEAVVLDAHTAEVLAMVNTGTIDPNGDVEKQVEQGKDFENPTISAPYEPGSVAKIMTASAAIEEGKTTPDEVHQVPGSIDMAGVTVRDAWDHGTVPYTTTGIFGKSSNVGTLMLAQRVGEDKFADYLNRFGIGQPTGVELPNESAGLLPTREQWSGGTFANLPIGQGMSVTALQMAGIFQALANGGERVEPRIIREVTGPDGQVREQEAPATTRVVSPETARTVIDMFRAVTQEDPSGAQQGTGANGAIEGYQTSGKTGTAQKVDPNTGAYSMSDSWITFGGVVPADNPRYVIAVMVDDPDRGVEPGGSGGQSAAPIYRDIGSWLLNRDNVPLSKPMEGKLILQAG